jgi:hypothetical protein
MKQLPCGKIFLYMLRFWARQLYMLSIIINVVKIEKYKLKITKMAEFPSVSSIEEHLNMHTRF